MARTSPRAPSRNGASAPPERLPDAPHRSGDPDVYLSVPDLHVDEIELDVENLQAHLALQARLANLLELRAGAHVGIEKVRLDIKGVAARAMLKVRLENVYAILDRALTSIDRNPQILEGVIDTVDETIEGVGRTVRSGGSHGKLARLGGGLRRLARGGHRDRRVTQAATAAGLIGGAALAAASNGGIEKTIKDLTS